MPVYNLYVQVINLLAPPDDEEWLLPAQVGARTSDRISEAPDRVLPPTSLDRVTRHTGTCIQDQRHHA